MDGALALDLELTRSGRLVALAATRGPAALVREDLDKAEIPAALAELARFGAGARLLIGHNLIAHDIPALVRLDPHSPLLELPRADTLVLSPLAFPERPYHALLKEDRLVRDQTPAPLSDCRATERLLADILAKARAGAAACPGLWALARAALTDPRAHLSNPGFGLVLDAAGAPPGSDALAAIAALGPELAGRVCATALGALHLTPDDALPLAYLLAWIRVPPGSRLPAWVGREHPRTLALLRRLRETSCGACAFCRDQHSPEGWLERVFGFTDFRPTPADADGRSLQRAIVAAGLANQPLYAVLPTGTGKSLCFQIPAAARYAHSAALTICVSPLQALMRDQVEQLRVRHAHAGTINGSLTPLERARALDELREGQTSLLYLSPEQLRSPSVRKALVCRRIGAWVLDEAHCLSEWGHDFRTDYLYIPRFIRELSEAQGVPPAPVQCFTGTSQRKVTEEILALFRKELGQELRVFDGGTERDNLSFSVELVSPADKMSRVIALLTEHLPPSGSGSAIVFCGTQRRCEQMAAQLRAAGFTAEHYHAGMEALSRREVQDRFLRGEFDVIAATSAFGMGVDKPDVRLVIHPDIPGSLESYLQQAGRAGRDRAPAHCALLFSPADVDQQFSLAALSHLNLRELQALWRAIRRVPARREERSDGPVELRVVTQGELARLEESEGLFDPADRDTPTRINAAVSWLERAGLFNRDENQSRVFQGRPKLPGLAAAKARIAALGLPEPKRRAWEAVMARLYDIERDHGLSADELAELAAHAAGSEENPIEAGDRLLNILQQMVDAGLLSAGVTLSAFLRWGVADSSAERLGALLDLQSRLLGLLSEQAPDPEDWVSLTPRLLAEALSTAEHRARPEQVLRLLRALDRDGAGLDPVRRSMDLRGAGAGHYQARVRRPWTQIIELGKRRAQAARIVFAALEARLPPGTRGADLYIQLNLEDLVRALEGDLYLRPQNATALAEETLLLLHDHKVITLQGGLSVLRPAMTLRRRPEAPPNLVRERVRDLFNHQDQRTVQIHVVHEYALQGTRQMDRALTLAREWFSAPREEFLEHWFKGRKGTLSVACTPESVRRILGELDDEQLEIVQANPTANLLVLAGPGSGKTRVLVHRVAWLVRVKRVRPEGVLVVCYTRANAIELRQRLRALIDQDARGITVSTLHGLALRLCGRSPQSVSDFDGLLDEALAVLQGGAGAGGADAEELRELALRGASHLFVDEYQDLDERQVRLIEAIGGLREKDEEKKLAVLAVGDDDQSIFGFRGGSAAWIRDFEEQWSAERHTLTACYRCPEPVLRAAAAMIAPVPDRLKAGTSLVSQPKRPQAPPVRRVRAPEHRLGQAVLGEIQRIKLDNPDLSWEDIAVLCPSRNGLTRVRLALEGAHIPFVWPLDHEESIPLGRVLPIVRFRERLEGMALASAAQLRRLIDEVAKEPSPWRDFLSGFVDDLAAERGPEGGPGPLLARALWEAIATERRERSHGQGLRLGTLHGAKGLEWPHVLLVDDGARQESEDALRRLFYVGMTRAKTSLTLIFHDRHSRIAELPGALLQDAAAAQHALAAEDPPLRYGVLHLDAQWVSWGGQGQGDRTAPLEALPYRAPLTLEASGDWLYLKTSAGERVGVIARGAKETWRERMATGLKLRLLAVVVRTREEGDPERGVLRERWLMPVCEARWRRAASFHATLPPDRSPP